MPRSKIPIGSKSSASAYIDFPRPPDAELDRGFFTYPDVAAIPKETLEKARRSPKPKSDPTARLPTASDAALAQEYQGEFADSPLPEAPRLDLQDSSSKVPQRQRKSRAYDQVSKFERWKREYEGRAAVNKSEIGQEDLLIIAEHVRRITKTRPLLVSERDGSGNASAAQQMRKFFLTSKDPRTGETRQSLSAYWYFGDEGREPLKVKLEQFLKNIRGDKAKEADLTKGAATTQTGSKKKIGPTERAVIDVPLFASDDFTHGARMIARELAHIMAAKRVFHLARTPILGHFLKASAQFFWPLIKKYSHPLESTPRDYAIGMLAKYPLYFYCRIRVGGSWIIPMVGLPRIQEICEARFFERRDRPLAELKNPLLEIIKLAYKANEERFREIRRSRGVLVKFLEDRLPILSDKIERSPENYTRSGVLKPINSSRVAEEVASRGGSPIAVAAALLHNLPAKERNKFFSKTPELILLQITSALIAQPGKDVQEFKSKFKNLITSTLEREKDAVQAKSIDPPISVAARLLEKLPVEAKQKFVSALELLIKELKEKDPQSRALVENLEQNLTKYGKRIAKILVALEKLQGSYPLTSALPQVVGSTKLDDSVQNKSNRYLELIVELARRGGFRPNDLYLLHQSIILKSALNITRRASRDYIERLGRGVRRVFGPMAERLGEFILDKDLRTAYFRALKRDEFREAISALRSERGSNMSYEEEQHFAAVVRRSLRADLKNLFSNYSDLFKAQILADNKYRPFRVADRWKDLASLSAKLNDPRKQFRYQRDFKRDFTISDINDLYGVMVIVDDKELVDSAQDKDSQKQRIYDQVCANIERMLANISDKTSGPNAITRELSIKRVALRQERHRGVESCWVADFEITHPYRGEKPLRIEVQVMTEKHYQEAYRQGAHGEKMQPHHHIKSVREAARDYQERFDLSPAEAALLPEQICYPDPALTLDLDADMQRIRDTWRDFQHIEVLSTVLPGVQGSAEEEPSIEDWTASQFEDLGQAASNPGAVGQVFRTLKLPKGSIAAELYTHLKFDLSLSEHRLFRASLSEISGANAEYYGLKNVVEVQAHEALDVDGIYFFAKRNSVEATLLRGSDGVKLLARQAKSVRAQTLLLRSPPVDSDTSDIDGPAQDSESYDLALTDFDATALEASDSQGAYDASNVAEVFEKRGLEMLELEFGAGPDSDPNEIEPDQSFGLDQDLLAKMSFEYGVSEQEFCEAVGQEIISIEALREWRADNYLEISATTEIGGRVRVRSDEIQRGLTAEYMLLAARAGLEFANIESSQDETTGITETVMTFEKVGSERRFFDKLNKLSRYISGINRERGKNFPVPSGLQSEIIFELRGNSSDLAQIAKQLSDLKLDFDRVDVQPLLLGEERIGFEVDLRTTGPVSRNDQNAMEEIEKVHEQIRKLLSDRRQLPGRPIKEALATSVIVELEQDEVARWQKKHFVQFKIDQTNQDLLVLNADENQRGLTAMYIKCAAKAGLALTEVRSTENTPSGESFTNIGYMPDGNPDVDAIRYERFIKEIENSKLKRGENAARLDGAKSKIKFALNGGVSDLAEIAQILANRGLDLEVVNIEPLKHSLGYDVELVANGPISKHQESATEKMRAIHQSLRLEFETRKSVLIQGADYMPQIAELQIGLMS